MIKKRIITGATLVLFSFFFYYYAPLEIKFVVFALLAIKAVQEMFFILKHPKDNQKQTFIKFGLVATSTLLFFTVVCLMLYPNICQNQNLIKDAKQLNFLFLNKDTFVSLTKSTPSNLNFFLLLFLPFVLVLIMLVFLPFLQTKDVSKTFLITFYIGFLMACLFSLFFLHWHYLLLFFLAVMLTDSSAFLARFPRFCPFLGTRPLAFHLSPKKTQKGAILGTFGSTITVLMVFLFIDCNSCISSPIYAFLISIISQISDLLASKFKRDYGIKDFGSFLPGHGGFLDRFDSWLLSSFFALILFNLPF